MNKWRLLGEIVSVATVIMAVFFVIGFWKSQAPNSDSVDPRPAVDFIHFYTLGYATARPAERDALESNDAWKALLGRLTPGRDRYARIYGPQVGLIFAPFSYLPLFTAYIVWSLSSLAVFGASVGWIVVRYARRLAPLHFWIVVGSLAFPPLLYVLILGHASVLAVVALVVATHGFAHRSAWVAGMGIGLLAYKPTLFIPMLLVVLGAGEFTVATVAIIVASASLLVTAPILGLAPIQAYVFALIAAGQAPSVLSKPELMCSLRTFWQWLLPPIAAAGFYVATAAVTVTAAAWSWRRITDPLQRIGIASVATALATPHFYYYDLVIIAPAVIASAAWTITLPSPKNWLNATTWAAYFAMLASPIVLVAPVQVPTLIFAAWFVAMLVEWTGNKTEGHAQICSLAAGSDVSRSEFGPTGRRSPLHS